MEDGRSLHQEDPRRFSVFISLCKLKFFFLSQALGSSYIVVVSPQLEMKDYAKNLCVMIDSNLAWKYHTQSICHRHFSPVKSGSWYVCFRTLIGIRNL